MKAIRYSKYVEGQLTDNIGQLVERGYFSEEEYAVFYIRDIVMYFQLNLCNLVSFEAPSFFLKYGKNLRYVIYRKSKRTTWYAFYEETDTEFHIMYLTNNHLDGHHII